MKIRQATLNKIQLNSKKEADEFLSRIKYIKYLYTVKPSKCDCCHNLKPNSRGILPVAALCINCQIEIGLRGAR